ncbi:aromatic ring-hydroxylating oxygenase subunit alpha [Amycolatopsis acidicola]|uniref:aromatic ring-hydroxylating oxygenase subunit alpha n=1 Tax=Amycolatopsis acidicola TaxID=2596893 RepID=UPI00140E88A9|nr:Rieske (2Fe-2S) protein [Amycolatopsis acidicola]
MAHEAELPQPGSFVTVDVAGAPLLVVRQDDGSIAVLSNVCRHRGARVELQPSGRRKMFSCPYHRWCYGRDGGIRSMPFDDGFIGVDRVDRSLLHRASTVRHGIVWTTTEPGTELDLDTDALAALDSTTLLHTSRTQLDHTLDDARATLPDGTSVNGLHITDSGSHLEVRTLWASGLRGETSELALWILVPAGAPATDHDAAEARWRSLTA